MLKALCASCSFISLFSLSLSLLFVGGGEEMLSSLVSLPLTFCWSAHRIHEIGLDKVLLQFANNIWSRSESWKTSEIHVHEKVCKVITFWVVDVSLVV